MKNMYLILSVLFLFTGCNEEEAKQQENSLISTWQLKEQWLGNVGDTSISWSEVADGYSITFLENNNYSSTEFTACQNNVNNGSFSLEENSLSKLVEISIQCSSTGNDFIRKYTYIFENDNLILTPFSHPCDEGCSYKFVKITPE